ncbi:MAG: hypothetical protein CMO74_08340 [Verrucomicrobiales bacterium]|nr:hypothetical protein [Verrucomicrobiales bacterium]|tara:strand:- start:5767 stop:6603 length:837 start_codon:yes stop_codon:yes gene_type:complete
MNFFRKRSLLHEGRQWAVLDRVRSPHGILMVIQREERSIQRRRLLNDELIQNTYDPRLRKSLSTFTGALVGLARAYTARVQAALCLGVGAGMVPRQLAADGAAVDAVEINPHITRVAEEWFDFDPAAVSLVHAEGRAFAEESLAQYDLIVLDVFLGGAAPLHFFTREAAEIFHGRLRPEGVLVVNTFGEFDPRQREMSAGFHKTLRTVFGGLSVGAHASGQGNVFHVAVRGRDLELLRSPDFSGEHPAIQFELQMMWEGRREFDSAKGEVLSDAMLGG